MKNLLKKGGYIIGLLFLGFYHDISAQQKSIVVQQPKGCATPEPTRVEMQAREQKVIALKAQMATRRIDATSVTYIPIKAHIIRRTNGTGGLSLADLNTSLVQANALYINVGIQFYFCGGSPNYINNDAYYDFNNSSESALCGANDVSNSINMYFANSIINGTTTVAGYAYFPSSSSASNRAFIANSSAIDTRTVPHELGHFFNLYHTFQGSAGSASDRELVTRGTGANCTTAGDLLCDTPSDPNGRSVDSTTIIGCVYSGNARDTQGQLYNPSLSNIMSYNPIPCGNDFTAGQYGRIANGLILRTDPSNQYSFNCPATVIGSNVPSNLTGSIGSLGLNLSFTDNATTETGFIIERSLSATSDFIAVAGLGPNITTWTDQSISSFTTYYYRVKASNSSTQYGTVFQITTALNYCIPLYDNNCSSVPVIIDDFILKDATTNAVIINQIASGCSPNSYGNFTATSYNVEVGKNYNFIARSVTGGVGTYYDQHLTIWIDYNRDGVFKTNEMVYKSNGTTFPRMNTTATGSFTIPNISSGLVRMRLRSGFGGYNPVVDSCSALPFGEAEDYTLNVISNCPTTLNLTANIGSGTSVNKASSSITATNQISIGAVVTYQAGTQIKLLPGFKAVTGSTFKAKIAGCNVAAREGIVEKVKEPDNQLIAFPNPANETVTFEYDVEEGNAELVLYNMLGMQVATVVASSPHQKGRYSKTFLTENLNSGSFLYVLKTDKTQITKKLVIVK